MSECAILYFSSFSPYCFRINAGNIKPSIDPTAYQRTHASTLVSNRSAASMQNCGISLWPFPVRPIHTSIHGHDRARARLCSECPLELCHYAYTIEVTYLVRPPHIIRAGNSECLEFIVRRGLGEEIHP